MSTSPFRIEPALEVDFPAIAAIVSTCFASMPVEAAIAGGPPTPESIAATDTRYTEALRLHQDSYSPCPSPFIKCVHSDPATGVEIIIGTAQWYIYPRTRTAEEVQTPHYLLGCEWMPDDTPDEQLLQIGNKTSTKAKVTAFFRPFLDGRTRLMGDSPHGVLMYMAVLPEWRRRGAASMCVLWGADRCEKLGIPAYLEASEEGRPVYEKLGFQVVENIESELEGRKYSCPIMVKNPR